MNCVIKPFKKQVQIPENFEQLTWDKLHQAIIAIQQNRSIACSREDLYQSVEELCKWKLADRLYGRLEKCCDLHITNTIQAVSSADTSMYLETIEKVWQDHCDQMMTIRSIFLYLDRTHIVQSPNLRSLWEMGLHLLRTELEQQQGCQVLEKLIEELMHAVEKERMGQQINRSQLYALLRMLSSA